MKKININEIPESEDKSPKGKYHSFYRGVSEALGREPTSRDLDKRHPFDLEWNRLPPGAANYPFHAHSAMWEMYLVVSGKGLVRDEQGTTEVGPGDAFLFKPTEAHQISNPGPENLVYYVIADNPIGECGYYPDSRKWVVAAGTKMKKFMKDSDAKYYDGEE